MSYFLYIQITCNRFLYFKYLFNADVFAKKATFSDLDLEIFLRAMYLPYKAARELEDVKRQRARLESSREKSMGGFLGRI